MTSINALYDSMFFEWPFKNGTKVKLLAEHNGIEPGTTGTVDLKNPNYFWVNWDDKRYSSFGKNQMYKLSIK